MTEADHNRHVYETRYTPQHFAPPPATDYFGKLYRIRLDLLKQQAAGRRILDVGCGGGAYLLPLLQDGCDIAGLDFSAPFLTEIRETWRSRGMDDSRLHLVQADARNMPLPDKSFGVIFSYSTLYSIPDFPRVLSEIARLLTPDGIAILDLGNVRSLNAIEAARIATGVLSYNIRLGSLSSLLKAHGFQTLIHRSFQIFPLYGGATPASRALNTMLKGALASEENGVLLDERVSSDPLIRSFAFRHLLVIQKTDPHAVPDTSTEPETHGTFAARRDLEDLRERRDALSKASSGQTGEAVRELVDILRKDPSDIRAVFAIGSLYDGAAEKEFVDHSSRMIERWIRRKDAPPRAVIDRRKGKEVPRVSVVLPTFNHRDFLPMAVVSMLAQSFEEYELIIVDDGSTDDTGAYLRSINHPRVRIERIEHKGLPGALNTGFRLARGEYFTWISADNFCSPLFLEALTGALDAHPECSLASSSFAWIDAAGRITGIHRSRDLSYHTLLTGNPGLASFLYRRSSAEAAGEYDTSLEGAEDWDLWLRMVENAPAVFVPEILYYYRRHENRMTATRMREIAAASERAFWQAFNRREGRSDITALYPLIAQCRDRRTAELHARWDFGTSLLQSPFGPPGLATVYLEEAFTMTAREGHLASTLAVAYARAGRTEEARAITRQLATLNNPAVQAVCTIIGPEDVMPDEQLLRRAPLFTVDKATSELFQLEREAQPVFESSKGAWVPRHTTARGSHA
jgi:glycosyltransferase involved in cell wall biosynthesis/ubiquinone/menaquinone biosynthesis C-methylase UbiE